MATTTSTQRRSIWQLAWESLQTGGPSMCQFAVTSACNARCGFCNFAVDKMPKEQQRFVTLEQAKEAAEILYKNGIYFMIYVG